MSRRRTLLWLVVYLGLSATLVAAVAPRLANFPPVSADEVSIMTVSFKLASQGVLGSDLYAGLYAADRHHFLALPGQHFFQAAFFGVFGAGVAQARAPSVLAGVIVLWTVGWLAYRWIGLGCSAITGILLLFWRSNLIAPDSRSPLVALAQSGRYDVTVLAGWWVVIVVLDRHIDRPRRMTAVACGLFAGLTALTQFYGAGALICCAGALWVRRTSTSQPVYARELALGALVPIALYAAYAVANWADFAGQAMLKPTRVRFYDLFFYMMNVANEWRRWEWLFQPSPDVLGAWLTLLAVLLAFLAGAQLLRSGKVVAFVSVLGTFLSLAILDSIKARIYASLVVPAVCFGLAMALFPRQPAASVWRSLRTGAGCTLIAWIVVDGLEGYRFLAREGPRVSHYSAVGERISASLHDPVPVFGSQRWWWALRTYRYRSLSAQWDIWQVEQSAGGSPDFGRMLERLGGGYLVLDNDTRGDLGRVPWDLKQQVEEFMAARTEQIASWRDPTYGLIEIYRF
jgi:hypothetical protein